MSAVLRAALTDEPIDSAEHEALVAHAAAGAVVAFAGVVRDHDGGRTVTRLEYSAHPSAGQTLADVVAEVAAQSAGVRAVAVSHRVGVLHIGDAALVAAVAADHRAPRSRRAHDWSTASKSRYLCGSTSSSPTAPTSGSTPRSGVTCSGGRQNRSRRRSGGRGRCGSRIGRHRGRGLR